MEDKDRKALGWILAGLYPFIFLGPLQILLAYPFPAWRSGPEFQVVMIGAFLIPLILGFTAGWLMRFPLWSYVYIVLMLLFLFIGAGILLDRKWIWTQDGPVLAGLLLSIGALALLVFSTRHNLPLRDLWRDIRSDWTRLSLGLLILPCAFFGAIDHEEDPFLTIFVIGPVVVFCLTALLALLAKDRQTRALILAGGMLLAILSRLPSGKWFYLVYWLGLVVIVFAPMILEQRLPSSKTNPPASARES